MWIWMATEDIQDLLVEEEVDEADLMEMASLDANQIDFEERTLALMKIVQLRI